MHFVRVLSTAGKGLAGARIRVSERTLTTDSFGRAGIELRKIERVQAHFSIRGYRDEDRAFSCEKVGYHEETITLKPE
jgi:hypothetical protein